MQESQQQENIYKLKQYHQLQSYGNKNHEDIISILNNLFEDYINLDQEIQDIYRNVFDNILKQNINPKYDEKLKKMIFDSLYIDNQIPEFVYNYLPIFRDIISITYLHINDVKIKKSYQGINKDSQQNLLAKIKKKIFYFAENMINSVCEYIEKFLNSTDKLPKPEEFFNINDILFYIYMREIYFLISKFIKKRFIFKKIQTKWFDKDNLEAKLKSVAKDLRIILNQKQKKGKFTFSILYKLKRDPVLSYSLLIIKSNLGYGQEHNNCFNNLIQQLFEFGNFCLNCNTIIYLKKLYYSHVIEIEDMVLNNVLKVKQVIIVEYENLYVNISENKMLGNFIEDQNLTNIIKEQVILDIYLRLLDKDNKVTITSDQGGPKRQLFYDISVFLRKFDFIEYDERKQLCFQKRDNEWIEQNKKQLQQIANIIIVIMRQNEQIHLPFAEEIFYFWFDSQNTRLIPYKDFYFYFYDYEDKYLQQNYSEKYYKQNMKQKYQKYIQNGIVQYIKSYISLMMNKYPHLRNNLFMNFSLAQHIFCEQEFPLNADSIIEIIHVFNDNDDGNLF